MTSGQENPRRGVPLVDVLTWIDNACRTRSPLASEEVSLVDALGRVLAEPLVSPLDLPPFRRAMMDGFAIAHGQQHVASGKAFTIVGESTTSEPYPHPMAHGEAVRIATGARCPKGTSVVVPIELCEVNDHRVTVLVALPTGKHVAEIGEDLARGSTVLPAGRCLRPQDLPVFATFGHSTVAVRKKPQVRIVVSGDEVRPLSDELLSGEQLGRETIDASSQALAALVARDGGEVTSVVYVGDDPEALANAFRQPCDVLLVTGGTSRGAKDYSPRVVQEIGELAIHGIAMRPAGPTGVGRVGETLVFLLSGHPASCLWAYDVTAARAVRTVSEQPSPWPYIARVLPLAAEIHSKPGRVDAIRVRVSEGTAEPLAKPNTALSGLTEADGVVIVPAEVSHWPAGQEVKVHRYDRVVDSGQEPHSSDPLLASL
jgi:molybdopterin molybdotransferase